MPVLCLPDGRVLRDSWEIVAESGLYNPKPMDENRRRKYVNIGCVD